MPPGDGRPLTCHVEDVLWINDVKVSTGGVVVTRDLQVGNGIDFTDMTPEDRLRLEQFLAVAENPQSPDSINQNQRQEES